jgi:flagellar biosynthesis regulator FlaF
VTRKHNAPDQGQDRLLWTVLVVRLPADPSRHRVAVWRELHRTGALMLGQGVWAVPATPMFTRSLERAVTLAERGQGEVVLLDAAGRDEANAARLEALFTAARQAEWAEFLADCGKYEAELDKELRTQKLTLAELDEEEQSLDRLRRWYRDIKVRDLFGAPAAAEAEQRLKHCAERLEDYAEQVYQAVHQS